MGLTNLSDADAKKVAEQVALILAPEKKQAAEVVEIQTVEKDMNANAFFETEAELIKQLASPKIIQLVTKRGARLVNLTENALNALHDVGRDRKIFKQFM